jgi:hypothetical protein
LLSSRIHFVVCLQLSPYGIALPKPSNRYAVGILDDWSRVRSTLRDLRSRGLVLDSLNCLALERLFDGTIILAPDQDVIPICQLPVKDWAESIACTCGPLVDCLMGRFLSGATSLKGALTHWLIGRHATQLVNAVCAGKIVLWIRLADDHDERRAYQSLLPHSSDVVGVHDLGA